jgi:hypothetical protein
VGTGEAARQFDPQIRTRKSRSAIGIREPAARAAADSILQLSRREKPPQEKAADKS